jgi:hypothetical protein
MHRFEVEIDLTFCGYYEPVLRRISWEFLVGAFVGAVPSRAVLSERQ